MRVELKVIGFMLIFVLASVVTADTFTHKTDGTSFTGFATQKVTGGKTLVYNSEEGKMGPVDLGSYEITSDSKGRRETVSLIRLIEPEILLSEVVSKKAAMAITEASNKGPQAIIVQIDSPGGRGSYAKEIALAISQTKNCPIIAHISGGPNGGVYSSASLIALACGKIYINPTAAIGAVGPVAGGEMTGDSYGNHLATYSSSMLVTYSTFAKAMAQEHNRPTLFAQALIDKTISIVEVANKDGSREFIKGQDRQPTQTLIRTFSEGMSQGAAADLLKASPVDVVGKVITLSGQEAVEIGLADALADSVTAVLADMNMAQVKLTPIPGVDKTLKKYSAARRNIAESLSRIEQTEDQVATLNEQFTEIDKQLRLGMQTREVAQGGNEGAIYRSTRNRYRFPNNYGYYYDNRHAYQGNPDSYPDRNSRRYGNEPMRSVSREEPTVDIQIVYQRLTSELQVLENEYRRLLNQIKRWPGALTPEISEATLRSNMNSVSAELDNLYRYQPVYPLQRQQVPTRTRNRSPRVRNPY